MELNGKRVLVVGLGKSGAASALFLKAHGARVTVSDSKTFDQFGSEIPLLLDHGIAVETGGHGERTFREQDLIVVSPGVPVDAPPLVQARARGEAVIGEIELAAQFLPGRIVAITGSNGKTTTTALAGEILAAGGFPWWSVEILVLRRSLWSKARRKIRSPCSKFPAFSWRPFRHSGPRSPSCSMSRRIISTAITPLPPMWMPRRASSRISRLMTLPCSMLTMATAWRWPNAPGRRSFGSAARKKCSREPGFVEGRVIFPDASGQREIMLASEIPLKGAHNVENVLAAVCAGALLGCAPERIREAVAKFKAVEHRLEYVATVRGVEYYNDSKATNVDATIKALESFPANIHFILGGKDKGSDYSRAERLVEEAGEAGLYHWRGGGEDRVADSVCRDRLRSCRLGHWSRRCNAPQQLPSRGTSYCWRPPAPASTNSAITSTAGKCSKKLSKGWPEVFTTEGHGVAQAKTSSSIPTVNLIPDEAKRA